MINIGIIGLGMMGRTHYEAYQKIPGCQVIAVSDEDPKRAAGDLKGTGGNVLSGGISQLPMDRIKGFNDYRKMIALPELTMIDICVPTTAHMQVAIDALASGKHVLCEKPLARTSVEAEKIARSTGGAGGFFMPAMCIRFWPAYAYCKQAMVENRYGKLLSATFKRVASMPGGWYHNGAMSGGAILDLHIHDTDFVFYLLGMPKGVFSRGYPGESGQIDHMVTHYLYDNGPLVVAEGSWTMQAGFGFSMEFTINFERATFEFDLNHSLRVVENGKRSPVEISSDNGYDAELKYFLKCIESKTRPTIVTANDGVSCLRIIEAEVRSIESGGAVNL